MHWYSRILPVAALFLTLAFGGGCAAAAPRAEARVAQAERYTGPIIDAHVHAMQTALTPDTSWFRPGMRRAEGREALLRETLAEMTRHRVVRAVTSGPVAEVAAWVAADPVRIIPGVLLFVGSNRDATLQRLRSLHAEGRLAVIGEIAWQYSGVGPGDTLVAPILDLAQELDVPVAIHMGPGQPGGIHGNHPEYRSRLSNPLGLEEPLARRSGLRAYVMHAGWPYGDDMVAMLYAFPDLYVDVAVINWYIPRAEFHAYLKRLVDAGFTERILFGSDQMWWPEAIGLAIEGVDSAPFLTMEQKSAIFCRNAQRFFRLDPALCTDTM